MIRVLNKQAAAILALIFTLTLSCEAHAYSIKSKYFNIYIEEGVDKYQLLSKLKVNYFLHTAPESPRTESDADRLIGEALDAIYLEVGDVMDIHMYTFSIGLDIVMDRRTLNDILEPYLNRKTDMPSFYYYDKNMIYISFQDLTVGMLAHEIAHALISHYFVVAPPAKAQEILAGYAEYSVRKLVKDSVK